MNPRTKAHFRGYFDALAARGEAVPDGKSTDHATVSSTVDRTRSRDSTAQAPGSAIHRRLVVCTAHTVRGRFEDNPSVQ